jgi:uncharacterized OsmC-like protein
MERGQPMDNSTIATALDSLSKVFEANPEKAYAKYARATATLLNGLKCRVTGPSGEQIETDMPGSMGGGGSSPNPGWFFRASLAACCSTMIAAQAARLGIVLTELEVTVTGEGDHRGMLGVDDKISAGHSAIRTEVRIVAPDASGEQLEQLVRWADEHSPVGCTVRNAPSSTLIVSVT